MAAMDRLVGGARLPWARRARFQAACRPPGAAAGFDPCARPPPRPQMDAQMAESFESARRLQRSIDEQAQRAVERGAPNVVITRREQRGGGSYSWVAARQGLPPQPLRSARRMRCHAATVASDLRGAPPCVPAPAAVPPPPRRRSPAATHPPTHPRRPGAPQLLREHPDRRRRQRVPPGAAAGRRRAARLLLAAAADRGAGGGRVRCAGGAVCARLLSHHVCGRQAGAAGGAVALPGGQQRGVQAPVLGGCDRQG
jgi:hypothetical protein